MKLLVQLLSGFRFEGKYRRRSQNRRRQITLSFHCPGEVFVLLQSECLIYLSKYTKIRMKHILNLCFFGSILLQVINYTAMHVRHMSI